MVVLYQDASDFFNWNFSGPCPDIGSVKVLEYWTWLSVSLKAVKST